MIEFNAIMVPLSASLGLSLVVERILELGTNVLEFFLNRSRGRKIPKVAEPDPMIDDLEQIYKREQTSQAVELAAEQTAEERKKIKAKLDQESDPEKRKVLLEKLIVLEKDGEWNERFSSDIVLVQGATDPDDGKVMKIFVLQFIGFIVGIFLAHYSGLQLFNAFFVSLGSKIHLASWFDYLLTGLLIGGGSKPMHILIRFISQRKIAVAEKPISQEEETQPATAPPLPLVNIATPPTPANGDWIEIPYKGGVDPEKLEYVHLREKDPELIVYHHTAMHSQSTFEDVVRVIQSRKDSKGNNWLTGYNCVVMADGTIRPFCRWDRYGNHATGYNRTSLGLAFNGNFEIDPNVPYSNPDGRLGLTLPSDIQLRAGARLVTLWTFLYKDINVDFDKSIIPHRQVSSKTCPGSVFPYDEFKRWIEFYRKQWEKSSTIKEQVSIFKSKPYLYVEKEV